MAVLSEIDRSPHPYWVNRFSGRYPNGAACNPEELRARIEAMWERVFSPDQIAELGQIPFNPPTKESPVKDPDSAPPLHVHNNAGYSFQFYEDHTKVFRTDGSGKPWAICGAFPEAVPVTTRYTPEKMDARIKRAEKLWNEGEILSHDDPRLDEPASPRANDLHFTLPEVDAVDTRPEPYMWPEMEAAANANTDDWLRTAKFTLADAARPRREYKAFAPDAGVSYDREPMSIGDYYNLTAGEHAAVGTVESFMRGAGFEQVVSADGVASYVARKDLIRVMAEEGAVNQAYKILQAKGYGWDANKKRWLRGDEDIAPAIGPRPKWLDNQEPHSARLHRIEAYLTLIFPGWRSHL